MTDALDKEREIIMTNGGGDIEMTHCVEFPDDTLVFMYRCTPVLATVIRRATTYCAGIKRFRTDTRMAIYVRGHRASSVLVKREYVDIQQPPPRYADRIAHDYWGHDA